MPLIIKYEGTPAEQEFMRLRIQPETGEYAPRNRVLDVIVLGGRVDDIVVPVIIAPYRIPGLSNTLPGSFARLDTSDPCLICPTGDHFYNERSVLSLEPLEDKIGIKAISDDVRVYSADDQAALFSWGLCERRMGDNKIPFVVKLFYHTYHSRNRQIPEMPRML